MLRTLAALTVAAAFLLAPTAAHAESYPPTTPPASPTLAGSAVTGICDGDVPYIGFSVDLTDPDAQSTGHTASLILSDGSNSTTIVLGELVNGHLSGRVLWPGASVNADGSPAGWPGWEFVDGSWVQTDGNFAWTRSLSSAEISVNPKISVPLSYPSSSPNCATGPSESATAGGTGSMLSATGVSAATVPVGIAAAGLVVVGGVVLLLVRRRRSAKL